MRFAWTFGLALCSASCQNTTGDPRSGGLYGWSREKAEQRQLELRAQADSTYQTATVEQAETAKLAEQKHAEEVEDRVLELRLNALTDENLKLEHQIAELRERSGKSSAELKKRLKELDASQKETLAPAGAPHTTDERRSRVEQLDTRNANLNQVLLLLLQK